MSIRGLSLAAILIAPLAFVSACKAETAENPGVTEVAATSASADISATAEATPSATPEPTATPGPKVIKVIGDEAFTAWTQRALELIETRAPEAYEEVLDSIDVIESVSTGSNIQIEERRIAVGEETAYAADYDEIQQLTWYAGRIVHYAHHSAMFIRGAQYTGKEAEIECLMVQKAALELLADGPFFANYVQGLIDGADDPANQYWNQPNRHW